MQKTLPFAAAASLTAAVRAGGRTGAGTRPRLIVFDHCKHVLMENVTVQNSPMWQIVPYYSDDLTFRNMKMLAPEPEGHNTDGIDPFSSGHVYRSRLHRHRGRRRGDQERPTRFGGTGAHPMTSPSPTARSFMDTVFASAARSPAACSTCMWSACTFNGTTQGIRMKSGRDRGGDIGDFTYKDITMRDVGTAIQITDYYGGDRAGACTDTSAGHATNAAFP